MAVPPNPLAINPLYAPIILENRGQPQFVLGKVNFLGLQYGVASDRFSLVSDTAGFSFYNPVANTLLVLQREVIIPNPGDPPDSILTVSRIGGGLILLVLFRVENVFVDTLNSELASSTFLTIPNSLKIKTQRDAPKLPANLIFYLQGQLVQPFNISRVIFAYQFIAGQPNIIRFDLTNFPGCMVFVKNRFGTADLPVQLDIDANGILTITGITPDAENPAFRSAMLMII